MDTLERARSLIKEANDCEDVEGYALTVAEAHAVAAIAQAEQLKRIADALHYQLMPVEVEPSPASDADESMANHRDNINRAREQMDGMRRGMGLDAVDPEDNHPTQSSYYY